MSNPQAKVRVAIACGGTGGHLYPGVAVAQRLQQLGGAVTLFISPKEVDQQAVRNLEQVRVATLPAVGLSRGKFVAFVRGFAQSYRACHNSFESEAPEAVLAMGGFTSAPPVLAGRLLGASVFLHESNTIPGRANRWLARLTSQAFVGFPEASSRLAARNVKVTGTPVRPQFAPLDAAACRSALGLDPQRPVLLVTGGSQGATALNQLVMASLPILAGRMPDLQLLHLTGPNDSGQVEKACAATKIRAVVRPFLAEMHLALGAASVAISRAGASSLAELAAVRVPAILVPYPAATDNHQYHNALVFEKAGAANLLAQGQARPEIVAQRVFDLIENPTSREAMRSALARWHAPRAAEEIAECILHVVMARRNASGLVARPSALPKVQHHRSAVT